MKVVMRLSRTVVRNPGALACLLLLPIHYPAQVDVKDKPPGTPAQPEKGLPPRVGQTVRSPEVWPDGRVTFRFRAANAKSVSLVREGVKRLPLTKDDRGTWSVTTDPWPPDVYMYQFVVDGVVLADPANPAFRPVVTGGAESMVHVPGPSSLSWEPRDVPHGILHRHRERSKTIGELRDFWVYTPPGYDAVAQRTYPTLYLLHGVMDDASAWTTAGLAQTILDNLIADGGVKPMLVVMPLGYGFANVTDQIGMQFGGPATQKRIMDVLTHYVLDELMPLVEHAYKVTKDREARAIAGLSMGGAQALFIGLNHPARFAWVGAFSSALVMFGEPFTSWFPGLTAEANPRLRLLWIACGKEDFLLGVNRKYKAWLRLKGVPFIDFETPGAHAWPVWRRNLAEFAPLLFR
jgi:enterochelin esterase family protein